MSESLTISTADGDFGTYVAVPKGAGPFPAVVVIQEIFGINPFVRTTADRLAALGYLAIAPDLFWRIEPGIDIPDTEMKKAFELFNAFDVPTGVKDIAATIAKVRADPRCNGKVGVVGYCLGGMLAFLSAANTDTDASVSYYGVGIDNVLDQGARVKNPLLMHLAGEDGYVPKPAQEAILAAFKDNPKIEIHVYPGRDHAFSRDGGSNYDAADATKANDRTYAFLKKALG